MKVPVHGDGLPPPEPNPSDLVHLPITDQPPEHLDETAQSLQAGVAPLEDMHRRLALMERVHALQSKQLRKAHGRSQELTRLAERAEIDALTGLGNQDAFNRDLESELARHPDVAIMVLDLDGFKEPNDQFGHAAGNGLIQAAAEVVKTHTRPGDGAYRWGGDEFAIMFRRFADPEEPEEALSTLSNRKQQLESAMAERLKAEVGQLATANHTEYKGDLDKLGATVAYGLKQPGDTVESLFERVDAQLIDEKTQKKADDVQAGFIPLIIMLLLLILVFIGLALWRVVASN